MFLFVLSKPDDKEYFDGGPNLFLVDSKGGSSTNPNKRPEVSAKLLYFNIKVSAGVNVATESVAAVAYTSADLNLYLLNRYYHNFRRP